MLRIGRGGILPLLKYTNKMQTTRYKGEVDGPSVVCCNHISSYDILCTLDIFPHYSRYIINDALIRKPMNRMIFSLITNGIYRRKGENADNVVLSCEKTIQDGINLCMFPEGSRSPNGVTLPIRKRTGTLIKDLNANLITYRLEGSYFIKPPWAKNRAKGPMYGGIIAVYTKEELQHMTAEEINNVIYDDLYINHYDWIKENRIMYERKDAAEYMERVLFTCPECMSTSTLHSHGDVLSCEKCGYTVKVDEFGLYTGEKVHFDNLYDWDVWQKEELRKHLPEWEAEPDKEIAGDDHVQVFIVKNDTPILIDKDSHLSITYREISVKSDSLHVKVSLDELNGIDVAQHNSLGISIGTEYYIISGATPAYCFRRYRTIRRIIAGEKFV